MKLEIIKVSPEQFKQIITEGDAVEPVRVEPLCECGHTANTHDPCCVSACGCDGFIAPQPNVLEAKLNAEMAEHTREVLRHAITKQCVAQLEARLNYQTTALKQVNAELRAQLAEAQTHKDVWRDKWENAIERAERAEAVRDDALWRAEIAEGERDEANARTAAAIREHLGLHEQIDRAIDNGIADTEAEKALRLAAEAREAEVRREADDAVELLTEKWRTAEARAEAAEIHARQEQSIADIALADAEKAIERAAKAEARAEAAEDELEHLGQLITEHDGIECTKHDMLVRLAVEERKKAEARAADLAKALGECDRIATQEPTTGRLMRLEILAITQAALNPDTRQEGKSQ